MNRGIFLARPDLDEEDLIETSKIIAESIRNGLLGKYETFFINLAKTYSHYKENLSKHLQEKQDFHGTRDFYNLIKQCARNLKKAVNLTEQELFNLGCKGLERNFGGFPDSSYLAKKIFLEYSNLISLENTIISKSYNILNAVEENIRDSHSRYLMIITKSSLSIYLLQFIMDKINKKFNIFTGSLFGDQMKEDYCFQKLNKIMVSMEQGEFLVLNNLEFIYPSLYDVFNSNFSTVGGRKFTRIVLGTTNNPLAPVHEDFRFVIIINSNDIPKQDPPFLQRFEKHILLFEDLLTTEEKELGENFNMMINEVDRSREKGKAFVSAIKNNCINCDKEEIFGLIKKLTSKEENPSLELIEDYILQLISPCFSQEFLAALKVSCFMKQEIIEKIYKYYNLIPHNFFLDYFSYIAKKINCANENEQRINLNVIYTYSSIFEELNFKDYFKGKEEKKKVLIETSISRFQSEAEYESFFHDEFISNKQKQFLILRFQAHDFIHLNIVKFFIDSFLDKIIERKKCVIIIFHLDKLKRGDTAIGNYGLEIETMSNLSSWQQIMIDNLNPRHNLDIITSISLNFEQILNLNLNLSEIIKKNLYPALVKIKYSVKNDSLFRVNDYLEKLIELMTSQPMIDLLIQKIKEFSKLDTDWIRELLYSKEDVQGNLDLLTILENFITKRIELVLAKLLGEFEKTNSLCFFFQEYDDDDCFKNKLYEIWKEYYESIEITNLMPIPIAVGIDVNKIQNLLIPLSINNFLDLFINYGDEFSYYLNAYSKNEDNLRYLKIKEADYLCSKKKICEEFENYFYNKTIFKKLIEINKPLAFKCIMNDFLNYYLIYIIKEDNHHKIYIDFLQEIVEYKFHNEFFSAILWLYTYYNSIKTLLHIYHSDSNYMKVIIKIEDFNKVKVFNEDKNYEAKKSVNYDFLVLLECIIEFYLPRVENLNAMSFENFIDYLKSLKCIYQEIQQFDYSLGLFSSKINDLNFWIELFSLITPDIDFEIKILINMITDIFTYPFTEMNKEDENYKKHIEIVKKVVKEDFINHLNKTNKELTAEKNEKINKFLVNFLISLFQKVSLKLKKYILEKIFEDDDLIAHSKHIINLILGSMRLIPEIKETLNETLENFGTFLNKDNEFLVIIEKKLKSSSDSKFFLQNFILYLFEYKISIYFSSFENRATDIFSEDVIEQLKKAIEILNQILSNPENCKFSNISAIYFVSFIKNFANVLVEIINEESIRDLIKYFNEVINPDNIEEHSNILKMIKLYVLKALMKDAKVTFEKFEKTDFNKLQLNWANDFFNLDEEKKEGKSYLNTIFSGIDNFEIFEKIMQQFVRLYHLKFEPNEDINKYFSDLDSQYIICLFDCIINKIMAYTLDANYVKQEIFRNYCKWMNEISKKISSKFFHCELIDKLLIFWKNYPDPDQQFLTFHDLKSEEFQMKILSYKALLLIFSSKKNGAYEYILNNLEKSVIDCYLPGGDDLGTFELGSGYRAIKKLISQGFGSEYGIYVCSCGREYLVPPCSFPLDEILCDKCFKIVGGIDHVIHNRPGHYRIYKDQAQFDKVYKTWSLFPNWLVNYKFFSDYEKIYFETMKKSPSGYQNLLLDKFNDTNQVSGDNSVISYRFLSFILHSIILIGYDIKEIKKETILKISMENYHLLYEKHKISYNILCYHLKEHNIDEPLIFMNIALEKFYNLINKSEIISSKEKCLEFEKKVDAMLNDLKTNFSDLKTKYRENSEKLDKSNIHETKVLLEETIPSEDYNKFLQEYPFLNLFMSLNIGNKKDLANLFKIREDLQAKYPLTHNRLIYEKKLRVLDTLPALNQMSNFFINYYSFRVSRKEAKEITIENAIQNIPNSELALKYFDEFKIKWEKVLSEISIKFRCQKEMIKKEKIFKGDPLALILNDDRESNNGMYIAAAYQQIIDYQNEFINNILEKNPLNSIIRFFKHNLEKEVIVQDSLPGQILRSELSGDFESAEEIIYNYSICNKKYGSGNNVIYDFEGIELELTKSMLPGICKFKNSDCQRFMTYSFEVYRSDNTGLLDAFCRNYPQIDLLNHEKNDIIEFCNTFGNLEKILSSIEVIISYYQRGNKDINFSLKNSIEGLPDYIFIDDQLKEFTCKKIFSLTLGKIVEFYEYVELVCFDNILKSVTELYKIEMEEDLKQKIDTFFEGKNEIFTKRTLSTIIRRFLSRFLTAGSVLEPNAQLLPFIREKEDLWPKGVKGSQEFGQLMEDMYNIPIQLKHSYELYKHLGMDLADIIKENKKTDAIKKVLKEEDKKGRRPVLKPKQKEETSNKLKKEMKD